MADRKRHLPTGSEGSCEHSRVEIGAEPAPGGPSPALLERLLEAPSPEQLYRQFLLGLSEAVPAIQHGLVLVKDANGYFQYLGAYGIPDELWRGLEGLPEAHIRADFPPGETAWYQGESHLEAGYHLPGLSTFELVNDLAALLPGPLSQTLTLPLLAEGQIWALLNLHGCELKPEHQEAVYGYLERVIGVVRQVHEHQQSKRRSLWLGAINSLLRLPREYPLETALQDALEEALRLSEADGARLVSFEGGEVRTLAQAGWGVGLETPERGRPVRALEVEAALTRTVRFKLSRGEQISIPRYDLYPDHRPELAEAGLSSLLALPVQRPGVEGGALLLFKTQSHWLPDLQTRELLQDMAAAIGIVRHERLLQEELSWAAYTDPLTGLGNRRAFERDLENLHRLDSGRLLMLALLDLDGFKAINDTYGHVHADHVLVRLGATLKARARAGDRAYRLGGDEFALIIEGSASLDVNRTAERYRSLVEEIKIADGEYLKASLGYAVLPDDASDLADLWRMADDRMYDDKALRRLMGGMPLGLSPHEARRNPSPLRGETSASPLRGETSASPLRGETSASGEPLTPEPSTPLSRLAARLGQAAGLGPLELQALAWAAYEGPTEAHGEVVTLPQAVLREAMALLGAQYERWDGKGLPRGLAGESIPLAVRVLQVVRDYLRLGGSPAAQAALRAEAGKAYDPRLVHLLAQIVGTPPDR